MRPKLLPIAACLFCLCLVLSADDQPAAPNGAADLEAVVYPVHSIPPDEIAASLRSLFGDSPRLRIVTAPNGKTLLIRVDPSLKDGVLKALEDLDPPAERLAVQVALVRRVPDAEPVDLNSLSGSAEEVWNAVRDLEGAGRVYVSDRMQTTTLSDQQSQIMIGQMRPVATGATTSGRGTLSTAYRYQNVGTILTFQGRAAPDGVIVCEIAFEKSELVEMPDQPIAEGIPGSRTDTTQLRSTVSLQSGSATLLSAAGSQGEQQDSYLILSATVLKPGDEGVAALFERGSRPSPRTSAFGSSGRTPEGEDRRFGSRGGTSELSGGRFGSSGGAGRSFGGGFPRPPTGLLATASRDDVTKLLELTEAQQTQVAELVEAYQARNRELSDKMREYFSQMQAANSDEEREKIRNEMTALVRSGETETDQKLAELLPADDFARLKQLDLQYSGYRALARDDIESALSLTAEQMSDIQQAVRNLGRSRFGGGGERPSSQDVERQLNEAAFAILTDEQRQTWLELAGEIVVDNGTPKE